MNSKANVNEEATMASILVVGGGVSGLYCAWNLARKGYQVDLMEMAPDRWGGRMETARMHDFVAEYGPMRFEPDLQPRFDRLIKDLGIKLVPFTGPSAQKIDFPKYDLKGDETGVRDANALLMLRRGLLLIMGKKLRSGDPAGEADHQAWIDALTESDYDGFRRTQTLPGRPTEHLWQTGLWNALAHAGMSHQAVMLIRDVGTFYHMIPDNLNAVEWTIWWLRAFKTVGAKLYTIDGGTSLITQQMLNKIDGTHKVTRRPGCQVTAVHAQGPAARVSYTEKGQPQSPLLYRHVILAIPQAPLQMIASASGNAFPAQIRKDLDTVNGFPMVKVFFVTNAPWWDVNTPPQTRANRMPTREVHYTYRARDKHGMVLIYTDRPATEYWKTYVVGEHHDRAQTDANDALKHQFSLWMAHQVHEAQHEPQPDGLRLTAPAAKSFAGLGVQEIAKQIESSVVTYGIRDWSRMPYGAANHSWKPGVKAREVMGRLKAFELQNGSAKNVHICGEAYSDYSGFIEGALNTAQGVLDAIVLPAA